MVIISTYLKKNLSPFIIFLQDLLLFFYKILIRPSLTKLIDSQNI
jgi:hypothetical protein